MFIPSLDSSVFLPFLFFLFFYTCLTLPMTPNNIVETSIQKVSYLGAKITLFWPFNTLCLSVLSFKDPAYTTKYKWLLSLIKGVPRITHKEISPKTTLRPIKSDQNGD